MFSFKKCFKLYGNLKHLEGFNRARVWPTALYSSYAIAGVGIAYFTNDLIYSDTIREAVSISKKELSFHDNKQDGIWVAINGKVYDLTNFIASHPGGESVILRAAGKDATKMFNNIHSRRVLNTFLGPHHLVGELIDEIDDDTPEEEKIQELHRLERLKNLPALSRVFNLNDFEYLAKQILVPSAWAYYSGGADDEFTLRENHYAFQRIYFNPRVLVDVRNVDVSTTMLGSKTAAPFYCSAAAMAELGHEDGELSIARACGKEGVIQMISSSASYSFDEIVDEGSMIDNMIHWFQLYVHPDRSLSYKMFEKCREKKVKAIFVTVDTPELGRREKDFKFRFTNDENQEFDTLTSYQDPGLTWKDIDNFKKSTDIPIVIKGVQTVQDVLLAIEHKVDGVVLSNHGGRQLEFSKAPIEVLAETMPILRQKKLQNKIEIFIDGGVRRGSDVVKALCLGAKGVGLGRPFLYANSGYGENGVRRAINLLKNEVELTMKLLGVTSVDELTPELLDVRGLHLRGTHPDMMYDANYDALQPPVFK